MIWFFVGIAAGFGIGAIAMVLATVASQADDDIERLYHRCSKENKSITKVSAVVLAIMTLLSSIFVVQADAATGDKVTIAFE